LDKKFNQNKQTLVSAGGLVIARVVMRATHGAMPVVSPAEAGFLKIVP